MLVMASTTGAAAIDGSSPVASTSAARKSPPRSSRHAGLQL
jgi:hypothetical protein